MKHLNYFFAILFLITSCSSDDDAVTVVNTTPEPTSQTVTGTISSSSQFSILNEALDVTNLKTVLDANIYTVLAPNNTAFEAFLTAKGYATINDVPVTILETVLLNHVINNQVLRSEIEFNESGYIKSNASGPLNEKIDIYYNINSSTSINGVANFVSDEIVTDNGVIHEINAVLALPTVYDMLSANPEFSLLIQTMTNDTPNTDFNEILNRLLDNNLDGLNPDFAIFAPNNAALNAIDTSTLNESQLTNILLHHVVKDNNIIYTTITANGSLTEPTIQGEDITIFASSAQGVDATITDGAGNNDITIINKGIQTVNGIIYISEKVLFPAQF
jgi:transforming growth factor-beta-induced protein